VHGFCKHHGIAVYRNGQRAERSEITLDAAAEIIGLCKMTALRMIRRGDIKAQAAPAKLRPWRSFDGCNWLFESSPGPNRRFDSRLKFIAVLATPM